LNSQWTPENFPGVKIELAYKKWTLIAFDSGTLILTGFGSYEEIPQAVQMINAELKLSRFSLGKEQFSQEEINESKEFDGRRSRMKRNSHGNKYIAQRRIHTQRTALKESKSHTRFRREDNSIFFAMSSGLNPRKITARTVAKKHKPY
jgi:hypothetical protein